MSEVNELVESVGSMVERAKAQVIDSAEGKTTSNRRDFSTEYTKTKRTVE